MSFKKNKLKKRSFLRGEKKFNLFVNFFSCGRQRFLFRFVSFSIFYQDSRLNAKFFFSFCPNFGLYVSVKGWGFWSSGLILRACLLWKLFLSYVSRWSPSANRLTKLQYARTLACSWLCHMAQTLQTYFCSANLLIIATNPVVLLIYDYNALRP